MLPISKPYQAKMTYAGEPIEAYSKLIDSIGSTFDKTKGATNSLDIALSQLKFLDGDAEIGNKILDKYKDSIANLAKDAAGNTRYDKAYNQVENLMVDFAKNTHLQHLGKNWAAAEEDRKKLADGDFNTKYIGIDNTKNFRSFNPDGTLNNYKSGIETRLDHEKAAARIIEQVAPEVINSVEGLSEQEKQMIGSQGLYKFVTIEKKDSDTYKKVWNHIRNVAKSTLELGQYSRFKGEGALDNLLMNEGLLRQYKAEKVDIEQSPTASSNSNEASEDLYGGGKYSDAFRITSDGAVDPLVKAKLLPTDYEDRMIAEPSSMTVGSGSGVVMRKVSGVNSKEAERIKELIDTIPSLKKYKNKTSKDLSLAAQEYNKNQTAKQDEANYLFASGKTLNIESSLPIQTGTFIDNLGETVNSGSSDVFILGQDTKDKANLKDKVKKSGKPFDFESERESKFSRILVHTKGDVQGVGFVYNLTNKKGEAIEVVKYDNELSSKLKPVLKAKENLYSLVKNHAEDIKEGAFKGDIYNFKTADGEYKVQPVYGNLTRYQDFKTLSAIYKASGNAITERPSAAYKVVDPQGNVDYYTPTEYDEFMKEGVINNSFIRNSFMKNKDSK